MDRRMEKWEGEVSPKNYDLSVWQLEFSTAGETAWGTCLRVYGSGEEGAGVFIHPPQAAVGWGLLSGMPVPQRFQLPPECQNWFLPWEREATQRVQGLSVAVWPLGRCLNYITGWGTVTWDTDGEKVTRKSLGNSIMLTLPWRKHSKTLWGGGRKWNCCGPALLLWFPREGMREAR